MVIPQHLRNFTLQNNNLFPFLLTIRALPNSLQQTIFKYQRIALCLIILQSGTSFRNFMSCWSDLSSRLCFQNRRYIFDLSLVLNQLYHIPLFKHFYSRLWPHKFYKAFSFFCFLSMHAVLNTGSLYNASPLPCRFPFRCLTTMVSGTLY